MKPNRASPLRSLMDNFPHAGRLDWIGLRRESHGDVCVVQDCGAIAGAGLDGDHRAASPGSRRQVTLIQGEHLPVVAGMLHASTVDPRLLRRNLIVTGINLLALKDRRFTIGDVLLEYTGPCEPCSRMERHLGPGGYNAMRGHGGITAVIMAGGRISVGDAILAVPDAADRAPQSGALF